MTVSEVYEDDHKPPTSSRTSGSPPSTARCALSARSDTARSPASTSGRGSAHSACRASQAASSTACTPTSSATACRSAPAGSSADAGDSLPVGGHEDRLRCSGDARPESGTPAPSRNRSSGAAWMDRRPAADRPRQSRATAHHHQLVCRVRSRDRRSPRTPAQQRGIYGNLGRFYRLRGVIVIRANREFAGGYERFGASRTRKPRGRTAYALRINQPRLGSFHRTGRRACG